MSNNCKHCSVLLATYNGASWLEEQIVSITSQTGVRVSVIASDDHSSDETETILKKYSSTKVFILPNKQGRFGRANNNFLRLIIEANIGDAHYISLADQDDVWYPDKLARAIQQLEKNNAVAYSANVEAFWPDGATKTLIKAYPQKKWDFMFGSPGPGCTFVLSRDVFCELRKWAKSKEHLLKNAWVHDWWIYAFVRNSGYKWVIDGSVNMRYRQHVSNEIGANKGFVAIKKRYAIIREGRYLSEVLLMSMLVGCKPSWLKHLKRMNFFDRTFLALNSYSFRRSPYDVVALFLIFIIAPRPNLESNA